MGTTAPASAREALEMVHAGLGYLATADPTALAAETQARCLQGLEQANSMTTAARASVLSAFTSGQGYSADAAYSPRAWLIHQTRITKGAAVGHTAWARRAVMHPAVVAALAAGKLSESYAKMMCTWTGKLPADSQATADEILLAAAAKGMGLPDLAMLAREMLERSRPGQADEDPGRSLEDRAVTLVTTFAGAGVLHGDLSPGCTAVVTAVLDALAAPAGAADDRTHEQRYHDALQEAMRRLLAADLLPERAGQPVRALVHVSLADLMLLDGSSALLDEWTAGVRAQWAAHRTAASVGGSDGGAWLDGDAARAFTCDASVIPVVTGEVNPAALEDLVRLCVQLDKLGHDGGDGHGTSPAAPGPGAIRVREALEQAIIGQAAGLLSGPGGLAGFLRRRQLGARLAGPSLPLDVGVSGDIPAAIRRAVILRDQHCRFPGGCDQPAAACEVHHLTHRADGGKTSVRTAPCSAPSTTRS